MAKQEESYGFVKVTDDRTTPERQRENDEFTVIYTKQTAESLMNAGTWMGRISVLCLIPFWVFIYKDIDEWSVVTALLQWALILYSLFLTWRGFRMYQYYLKLRKEYEGKYGGE